MSNEAPRDGIGPILAVRLSIQFAISLALQVVAFCVLFRGIASNTAFDGGILYAPATKGLVLCVLSLLLVMEGRMALRRSNRHTAVEDSEK